ncbi:MAG: hypothetical protein [Microviridae sp.]|nr:MAG: hypothetical protein [Microviridae sp.]
MYTDSTIRAALTGPPPANNSSRQQQKIISAINATYYHKNQQRNARVDLAPQSPGSRSHRVTRAAFREQKTDKSASASPTPPQYRRRSNLRPRLSANTCRKQNRLERKSRSPDHGPQT